MLRTWVLLSFGGHALAFVHGLQRYRGVGFVHHVMRVSCGRDRFLGDALQIFLFGPLTETTVLITLLPLSIPTFQTKRAASRAEGALEKRAR